MTIEKPSNTALGLLIILSIAVFWRTENVGLGVMVGAVGLVVLYGYGAGVWDYLLVWARPYVLQFWHELQELFNGRDVTVEISDPYELCVGRIVVSRQYLYTTLQELGSFLVFAITGGGKTSFLHSIIHQLISSHKPKDLQLVVADLKEGLDFRIYRKLPHLALPIATSVTDAEKQITWLKNEMSRRAGLYKAIPSDRICNNLASYHMLGSEYGLEKLPWILAIIDEFQNITLESKDGLEGLIKLAKEGRAFGITIIASTQLPKVEDVPTRFKSQFPSWFCGYLASPSHYQKIVEVDKEIFKPFHDAGKIVGRFIANVGGEKFVVISPYIAERELERVARKWSEEQEEPGWPEMEETAVSAHPRDWDSLRTRERKQAALYEWFAGKGEMPLAEDFMDEFGTSLATYYNWVPQMWDEFYSR